MVSSVVLITCGILLGNLLVLGKLRSRVRLGYPRETIPPRIHLDFLKLLFIVWYNTNCAENVRHKRSLDFLVKVGALCETG